MFMFACILCLISVAMANGSSGVQDVLHGAAGQVAVRGPSEAVSSSSEFTHDAIMLLIEAMAARWDLYGQRERSRLFQSVQQELEGHGYPLPVERIRRKWNNLIVTYKRVKERCRGRGQARTSWEYYEVRSELQYIVTFTQERTCITIKYMMSTTTSSSDTWLLCT